MLHIEAGYSFAHGKATRLNVAAMSAKKMVVSARITSRPSVVGMKSGETAPTKNFPSKVPSGLQTCECPRALSQLASRASSSLPRCVTCLYPFSTCGVDVSGCVKLYTVSDAGVYVREHPTVGESVGFRVDVVRVAVMPRPSA